MILNINSLIQIHLAPEIEAIDTFTLGTEFISYFTTEMSPMYASVIDVRRLVGAFITEIPDDVINQLILEWSFMANDLSSCNMDYKWLRYANKWVTYKVSLIIMYNTEEFRGVTGAKDFKQLGDLSISKGGSSSDGGGVGKMIEWLECEAFKYEFSVRTCELPAMNCLGLTDNSAMPYTPSLSQLTEKGLADSNKLTAGRQWISVNNRMPRGNNTLYINKRKYKTNLGTRGLYGN